MTRDEFTQGTFARDGHQCVVPGCGQAAVDAHHIIERKLWLKDDPYPDGYHLDNGASLCEKHHIAAEAGHFPPQALRRWLDLPIILPQQLDPTRLWDKWGKEIETATLEKYPRTPYFNFSESQDPDDDCIDDTILLGKPLVFTTKIDGSNVTLTRDRVAARNGQYANHPSFNYLKQLHAGFKRLIPSGTKLFCEWVFAKHSIAYEGKLALPSYLQVFAIYTVDIQLFWSWQEVVEFCKANNFCTVPELGSGRYAKKWELIKAVADKAKAVIDSGHEGLVVKNTFPFHFSQHAANVAKIVRQNHVQTTDHWSQLAIVKNELANS